jgi:hypothetical protein
MKQLRYSVHSWYEEHWQFYKHISPPQSQRHKYVKAFAYDALRATIHWRLDFIDPIRTLPQPPNVLRFLPLDRLDFSDRPIAILRARHVDVSLKSLVPFIMSSLETMRKNVCELNGSGWGRGALSAEPNEPHDPVLQYALVVDLESAPATSLVRACSNFLSRSVVLNIMHYLLALRHDFLVPPRGTASLLWHHWHKCVASYSPLLKHDTEVPGIFAVYVINYGWAHKSVWRVAKYVQSSRSHLDASVVLTSASRQVLPASVNAKIIFCSSDDLPFLHSHTATSGMWNQYYGIVPPSLNTLYSDPGLSEVHSDHDSAKQHETGDTNMSIYVYTDTNLVPYLSTRRPSTSNSVATSQRRYTQATELERFLADAIVIVLA